MKINHEYLTSKGFELLGEEEDDPYYRLQLDPYKIGLVEARIAGSFNKSDGPHNDGFELYGYGFIESQDEMEKILNAIAILGNQPSIEHLIYKK